MSKQFLVWDINQTPVGKIEFLHDTGKEDPLRSLLFVTNYPGVIRLNLKGAGFAYCYEDDHGGIPMHHYTGMYMRKGNIINAQGKYIIMQRIDHCAPFLLGGPIEETGRLKYIDGCTDSLLIPPLKKGDPCLNHLHFPKNIDQTMHTHPSVRMGIVARGRGQCIWIDEKGEEQVIDLVPGLVWIIPTDLQHKFRTTTSTMDVIAYHPDSDYGPEDENHPMINRTMVEGVSANQIDDIKTK